MLLFRVFRFGKLTNIVSNGSLCRETIGDASESAILKWMELTVGNVSNYRGLHKKVCEIPFNSTNKYQVDLNIPLGSGYDFLSSSFSADEVLGLPMLNSQAR